MNELNQWEAITPVVIMVLFFLAVVIWVRYRSFMKAGEEQ